MLGKPYNASVEELLSWPVSRIWYLLEEHLEMQKYVDQEIVKDDEAIAEDIFDDEWKKQTSLPDWLEDRD